MVHRVRHPHRVLTLAQHAVGTPLLTLQTCHLHEKARDETSADVGVVLLILRQVVGGGIPQVLQGLSLCALGSPQVSWWGTPPFGLHLSYPVANHCMASNQSLATKSGGSHWFYHGSGHQT